MKLQCFFAIGVFCCSYAHAAIYKSVDANGNVTYSNTPLKGAKKLHLAPLATFPAESERSNKSGKDFPKIDAGTQKQRDIARQKILKDELTSEELALSEAQKKLQLGAQNPETYTDNNGNVYRDASQQENKMNALQEKVLIHEKNIAALKTELANIEP